MRKHERGSMVFFVDSEDETKLIGFGIELGSAIVRINIDGTIEPKVHMAPVLTAEWPVNDSIPVFRCLAKVASAFWCAANTGADGVRVIADVVKEIEPKVTP